MIDSLTQFLNEHWDVIISLVKIALIVFIVLTVNAYLTWFERKVVAHMQSRWGPHRVGPHGLLQPLADGAKYAWLSTVAEGTHHTILLPVFDPSAVSPQPGDEWTAAALVGYDCLAALWDVATLHGIH